MAYPRKSSDSFWELTDKNVLDFVFALKKGSVLNPEDYDYPAGPVFAETVKWCQKDDGKSNIQPQQPQPQPQSQPQPQLQPQPQSQKQQQQQQQLRDSEQKRESVTIVTDRIVNLIDNGNLQWERNPLNRTQEDIRQRRIRDGKEELPEDRRITTKEPDGVDSKTAINVDTKTRPRAETFGGGMIGGYANINPYETNWLLTDKNLIKQM